MKKLLLLLLLMAPLGHGAITANTHWNVRQDGTSTGGSCFDSTIANAGTDFSHQAAVHMTIDNAAITATTAGANSNVISFTAGYTVAAADVGNCVQMTAGTNINAGFYQITAQTHTDCATFTDCTWTVSGATNLTTAGGAGSALVGKMGGALGDTFTTAIPYVAGNTIDIGGTGAGTGSFTRTSTLLAMTVAGTATAPVKVIGYTTTPGDSVGTAAAWTGPTFTSATNSIALVTFNAVNFLTFKNMKFTHTAATRGICLSSVTAGSTPLVVDHSVFDGCLNGVSEGSLSTAFLTIKDSIIKNSTGDGLSASGSGTVLVVDSQFINNSTAAKSAINYTGALNLRVFNSIFAGNTDGLKDTGTASTTTLWVANSTFDANGRGIYSAETTTAPQLVLENNIFWNNSTGGLIFDFSGTGADNRAAVNRYNAYGSNGANHTGLSNGLGDVTLTGSPFTSSTNWALNNTAGAGAACRGAGFPGAMIDGVTIGYRSIGAVQEQSTAAAGTRVY